MSGKNQVAVASGKLGAAIRWGVVPRRARLDPLTDAQRLRVFALIERFTRENEEKAS